MSGPIDHFSTKNAAGQEGDALSLGQVLKGLDENVNSGDAPRFLRLSTGFTELDRALGGGFSQGQLILLSGHAGIGKTSLCLQMARNIAASNAAHCLFVCYEHEPDYLLQRLIAMESLPSADAGPGDGLRLLDIEALVKENMQLGDRRRSFTEAIRQDARGARALDRISRYANRLHFMKGSSYTTNVAAIGDAIKQMRSGDPSIGKRPVVLFVDYLQKIPVRTSHAVESARNVEEVEGLKEIALQQDAVVMAIVAAEVEGLRAKRLELEHLLASPAIAYEADVIMLMNEKYDMLERNQVDFNRYRAEQARQYVVLSIEKNRSGSDLIDLELRKQLQYWRFHPEIRRTNDRFTQGKP